MDTGYQGIDDGDQVPARVRPENSTVVTDADADAVVGHGTLEVMTNDFEFIHRSNL